MAQKKNWEKIIYLADDDEDDRLLFLDAVQDLDLPVGVKAANDGQQLLNALYEKADRLPDIIFLDINMPIKNGFGCLEEIRSREDALKEVKIVMLSTSKNPDNIELCHKLGADLYAVKPSTFQGLKDLLQKVFEMDWGSVQKSGGRFLLA